MYSSFLKRFLDIMFSLIALICLLPLFTIVAIAIKLDSRGPVIFKQIRLGRNLKPFALYKFRSMIENAEYIGSGVYSGKGDSRVTRIGRVIRATSVDELPQLINVLKGDMSLIGPRPPLTYHPWTMDKYTDKQKRMFEVRPGITGWAQVNGRKHVEWTQRIELNIWYIDNISFLLDLRILFLTILKIITNESNLSECETVKKLK